MESWDTDLKGVFKKESWQILHTALLSWQWPPATHPYPWRAAGNIVITFSSVEFYSPPLPHTQRCLCSLWRHLLMARIFKKKCAWWFSLGKMSVFIVRGNDQALGFNAQVLLSPWADRISLTLQSLLNVIVKCWIRLFWLSNASVSRSICLIYPSLCSSSTSSWVYHPSCSFFVQQQAVWINCNNSSNRTVVYPENMLLMAACLWLYVCALC